MDMSQALTSLDTPIGDDEEDSIGDLIADDGFESPYEMMVKETNFSIIAPPKLYFPYFLQLHLYILLNLTTNSLPFPGELSTLISPCMMSTTLFTKARPNPFPCVA